LPIAASQAQAEGDIHRKNQIRRTIHNCSTGFRRCTRSIRSSAQLRAHNAHHRTHRGCRCRQSHDDDSAKSA
jgi:hypothetical protein